MNTPFALFFAGFLSLPGCVQLAWAAEVADDPVRNGVRLSQLTTHPVRSAGYWQQQGRLKPLLTRIGPAPAELVEFIRLDNAFQGYSEMPVAASPNSAIAGDAEAAMAGLPPVVRGIAERRLFYIALVRNLGGGTGYMDVVTDSDGSAAGGFIVLDEDAIDRTANAWASWREASAFKPGAGWSLEAHVEAPDKNNRVNAIRYILLHELGHVVDAVLGVTPVSGSNAQNMADNGFYSLSWIEPLPAQGTVLTGDTMRSRFDAGWPGREKLVFYAFDSSAYDISDAPAVYTKLRETNFPTLYAATSPADDFAESFVNYVHVVLDGLPYEIRLRHGGKSEFLFDSCWDDPRCASKKAVMQRLLLRAKVVQ